MEQYLGYTYSDVWADEELCKLFDWVHKNWNVKEKWHMTMEVALALCSGARRMDLVGREGHPEEGLKLSQCKVTIPETPGVPPLAQIVLPHSKGKRKDNGKGKLRFVDLLPEFAEKFRQRLQDYRDRRWVFVFQNTLDRRLGSIGTRQADILWKRAMKEAKVRNTFIDAETERVRPMGIRAARRTFATYSRLLRYQDEEGNTHQIRFEDLMAQMGHADPATTARYYLRSLPGSRFVPRKIEFVRHI